MKGAQPAWFCLFLHFYDLATCNLLCKDSDGCFSLTEVSNIKILVFRYRSREDRSSQGVERSDHYTFGSSHGKDRSSQDEDMGAMFS